MAYLHPSVNVAKRLILDFLQEVISYIESKHLSILENSSIRTWWPSLSPTAPIGAEIEPFAQLLTPELKKVIQKS